MSLGGEQSVIFRHLEHPLDHSLAERVLCVLEEIFGKQFAVFVGIEFEKLAVQNVKMFITEVLRDLIDVGLLVNMQELLK